ncbi:MAG: hypothetical protein M3409_00800, partial [Gemmatimonadota bacterium]|nr:hypothetical protein [Gemmatimonadota bacterium]
MTSSARTIRSGALAALFGLVCTGPPPASAQTADADSARVHRSARQAQGRFEMVRRTHLPWTWRSGGGPCDERIGRFCLTHDIGGDEWKPPPEPAAVAGARDELRGRLDTLARLLPGDGWIGGQRVRYHLEAGSHADAVRAADACRADAGWCGA